VTVFVLMMETSAVAPSGETLTWCASVGATWMLFTTWRVLASITYTLPSVMPPT
jgi:hypothetical protein